MAVIVLLGVGLGWFGWKLREAERQRKAVEAIENAGGVVMYDYEFDESGTPIWERKRRAGPRKLLGEGFFADVVVVWLDERTKDCDVVLEHVKGLTNLQSLHLCGTQITDRGLDNLKGLTNLEFLDLLGTQVTSEGIEELRKAVPDCEIRH